MPAFGHINPMLIIIKELVRLGHNVTVYNGNDFRKIIESTGAKFKLPPISIEIPDFKEFRDSFKIAETSLMLTKNAIVPLIEEIKKDNPDFIVHDSLSLWGKLAAQYLDVPAISLVPSMGINVPTFFKTKNRLEILLETVIKIDRFMKISTDYSKLYKSLGLKPPIVFDIFSNSEKLNIIFTSREIQIAQESFKSNYKFVGPSIYARSQSLLPEKVFVKGKKIIYISLGTIYNEDYGFYNAYIDAFRDTDFQVFMAIGNSVKLEQLKDIPNNFYVKEYLPQLQILQKSNLFISHGGMNSINESCYYGTPMLFFPQMLEQKINALRIEELGAGIVYGNKPPDGKRIYDLATTIIGNKKYKKRILSIKKNLRKSGGYKAAVKYINDFINRYN
jgi:MGT family glycosyltransferase